MPVIKYNELKRTPVLMDGVRDATKAVPLGADLWPDHALRVFTLKPGGFTPHHKHDWEHINYVIGGRGRLTIDGKTHEVSEKDFAVVPSNAEHQFENPYDEMFEFICIVPERGEY